MEQMLEKKLPVGTTAEQVEKILAEEKIEHSFVAKENAFYAIIRGAVRSNQLVKENVTLVITLDDRKQVKEVKVKRAFTGP